jgi:hypothetical protein
MLLLAKRIREIETDDNGNLVLDLVLSEHQIDDLFHEIAKLKGYNNAICELNEVVEMGEK